MAKEGENGVRLHVAVYVVGGGVVGRRVKFDAMSICFASKQVRGPRMAINKLSDLYSNCRSGQFSQCQELPANFAEILRPLENDAFVDHVYHLKP